MRACERGGSISNTIPHSSIPRISRVRARAQSRAGSAPTELLSSTCTCTPYPPCRFHDSSSLTAEAVTSSVMEGRRKEEGGIVGSSGMY